ncbi:MAG: LPS export ABC transporter periplasmic protein LptC [Thermoflavifilum sp.]|uniref:LPS export ABC transporter periplasmic protein LptC n=1 Tax=Thermoflavifilum sp. TaxID=1968839 RepID=UPI0018A37A60|nr:LPS export ABC transporter periplasmic protein LptC [Thermoflavifilum sp.]QOR76601.1 MAG: LPS export ABC transporter periplasmic protein LptC [Thermoflavifilum sp.]
MMLRVDQYMGLLAAGLVLCVNTGCVNKLEDIHALHAPFINVETADSVRILYSQNGRVRAEIQAPYLKHYQTDTPRVVMYGGLQAHFFNDSLQVESTLTAEKGVLYEENNRIAVEHHVVVMNVKGERLECDSLYWDPSRQIFVAPGRVKITTASQLIYGKGLEASADFTTYKVLQVENSQIMVNKSELPGS